MAGKTRLWAFPDFGVGERRALRVLRVKVGASEKPASATCPLELIHANRQRPITPSESMTREGEAARQARGGPVV
jgi:hypothetical protein